MKSTGLLLAFLLAGILAASFASAITECQILGFVCCDSDCWDTCQIGIPVADGTPCSIGTCQQGVCVQTQPQVPEFSAISAGIALIGSALGFIALRRKK